MRDRECVRGVCVCMMRGIRRPYLARPYVTLKKNNNRVAVFLGLYCELLCCGCDDDHDDGPRNMCLCVRVCVCMRVVYACVLSRECAASPFDNDQDDYHDAVVFIKHARVYMIPRQTARHACVRETSRHTHTYTRRHHPAQQAIRLSSTKIINDSRGICSKHSHTHAAQKAASAHSTHRGRRSYGCLRPRVRTSMPYSISRV